MMHVINSQEIIFLDFNDFFAFRDVFLKKIIM